MGVVQNSFEKPLKTPFWVVLRQIHARGASLGVASERLIQLFETVPGQLCISSWPHCTIVCQARPEETNFRQKTDRWSKFPPVFPLLDLFTLKKYVLVQR